MAERFRVLVIDDDPGIREYLQALGERQGYQVSVAADGESAIESLGECDKGDWRTLRTDVENTLDEFHEYSVEWSGGDLVYRVDGVEVHRNEGLGENYPEPMFAILNYAKITDSPMEGEWVMEVDWVKHEYWR